MHRQRPSTISLIPLAKFHGCRNDRSTSRWTFTSPHRLPSCATMTCVSATDTTKENPLFHQSGPIASNVTEHCWCPIEHLSGFSASYSSCAQRLRRHSQLRQCRAQLPVILSAACTQSTSWLRCNVVSLVISIVQHTVARIIVVFFKPETCSRGGRTKMMGRDLGIEASF